jgi:protein-S-isoprenylcysteine O-methyltransferase Ste14
MIFVPPSGPPEDIRQYLGPSAMHEEAHVLKRELVHLREEIERVKQPRRWLNSIGFSAVATAAAAVLSWLSTIDVTFPSKYSWVRPTFVIAAIALSTIGLVFLVLDWRLTDDFESDMGHVRRRVNELIDLSKE